jgi:hypothetical protein
MSAALSPVALDVAPAGGSCSLFTVFFFSATAIVLAQLVRRRRQARDAQSDTRSTGEVR